MIEFDDSPNIQFTTTRPVRISTHRMTLNRKQVEQAIRNYLMEHAVVIPPGKWEMSFDAADDILDADSLCFISIEEMD